jgi:hypothetical protein
LSEILHEFDHQVSDGFGGGWVRKLHGIGNGHDRVTGQHDLADGFEKALFLGFEGEWQQRLIAVEFWQQA